MATYVILSRIAPEAFNKPEGFKGLAATVKQHIEKECPAVKWKESYATLGRFDSVDVIESDDAKQVEHALLIIWAYGHSSTETLLATPWKDFVAMA